MGNAIEFYEQYNLPKEQGWTPYIVGALGGIPYMDSYTPVSQARNTINQYTSWLRQDKGRDWTMPELVRELEKAAEKYGIDKKIAYDQIYAESSFNIFADSGKAQGIAQFTPDTARRFGLDNPYDPIASFDAWGRYMRLLLNQFDGDYSKALASYNWGEGRVMRAVQEYGADWQKTPRLPKETKGYLAKILGGASPQGSAQAPGQGNAAAGACGTFDIACQLNNFLSGDTAKDVGKRIGLVLLAVVILAVAIVSLR